jgi:hypothetical protein
MTREQDRLKFQKKANLNRAYGIILGLIEGIQTMPNHNKEGLIKALEEVRDIIEEYSK